MCEPGSLGVGYRRYVYDIGRRCLSASIPARAHVEGAGCQPGLAHTESEFLVNFFNMLICVSRGDDCDRELTRQLTIDEVREHAKFLRDRMTNMYDSHVSFGQVGRVMVTVIAALVTLSPFAFFSLRMYLSQSSPTLPMCAATAFAASILLLVLAVIKRGIHTGTLSSARRIESLRTVLSDVIESTDMTQMRKRIASHLHKGHLHAAFELNRPKVWSFSRQGLGLVAITFCIVSACFAALYFDVIGSVRALRDAKGSIVGGSFLGVGKGMSMETFHVSTISIFVLGLAVVSASVAWCDIV